METKRRNQPEADSHTAQYWGWYYLMHEILTLWPQPNWPANQDFYGSETRQEILSGLLSWEDILDSYDECLLTWINGGA